MKTKQLTLIERQHCNGTPCSSYTLAAWHWKWSLTWRWNVTWTPQHAGKIGLYFMRTHRYGTGLNFLAGLNLPLVGSLSVQTQPNMPLTPNVELTGASGHASEDQGRMFERPGRAPC